MKHNKSRRNPRKDESFRKTCYFFDSDAKEYARGKWLREILEPSLRHASSTLRRRDRFKNGGDLKTHQMFYALATPEEYKNETINGHFGFV